MFSLPFLLKCVLQQQYPTCTPHQCVCVPILCSIPHSGQFRKLVDINFICAMGPPGGGRHPISARLSRHFNYLSFTELEDASKYRIFSTILESWLAHVSTLSPQHTPSCLTCRLFPSCQPLLPGPSKVLCTQSCGAHSAAGERSHFGLQHHHH